MKLRLNKEKQFHLIFTTYQNYPLALIATLCESGRWLRVVVHGEQPHKKKAIDGKR